MKIDKMKNENRYRIEQFNPLNLDVSTDFQIATVSVMSLAYLDILNKRGPRNSLELIAHLKSNSDLFFYRDEHKTFLLTAYNAARASAERERA